MSIPYEPYFYLTCRVRRISHLGVNELTRRQGGTESIVEEWLLKRYEGIIIRIEREKKWDLSLVSCGHVLETSSHARTSSFQSHCPSSQTTFYRHLQYSLNCSSTILPISRLSDVTCYLLHAATLKNSRPLMLMPMWSVRRRQPTVMGMTKTEHGVQRTTRKRRRIKSRQNVSLKSENMTWRTIYEWQSISVSFLLLTRESALISRTIRYSCRTLVYRHLPHGRYNAGTNTRSCQACGPGRHGV